MKKNQMEVEVAERVSDINEFLLLGLVFLCKLLNIFEQVEAINVFKEKSF